MDSVHNCLVAKPGYFDTIDPDTGAPIVKCKLIINFSYKNK